MSTVNLTDAKARLPYYVARAVQGEEIIILRENTARWAWN